MKLLKIRGVIAMTTLSKASIYRLENAGKFPKRIHVSPRSVAWILEEVEQWIESKKSLR